MYCIQIFWFILLQSLQVCGMDESTDEKPYSIVIPVIVAISFLFCFLSIKSYRIPGYLVFQLCALDSQSASLLSKTRPKDCLYSLFICFCVLIPF